MSTSKGGQEKSIKFDNVKPHSKQSVPGGVHANLCINNRIMRHKMWGKCM